MMNLANGGHVGWASSEHVGILLRAEALNAIAEARLTARHRHLTGLDYEQGIIDVCSTAATELGQGAIACAGLGGVGQVAVAESQQDQASAVRKPRRS